MGILVRCHSAKYRPQSGTTFSACFCSLPHNPWMEIMPTVSRTDSRAQILSAQTNKCVHLWCPLRTWNLILVTQTAGQEGEERHAGYLSFHLEMLLLRRARAGSVRAFVGTRRAPVEEQDQEQFALSGLQSPFIWRCGHYRFGFLTVPWIAPYFSRGKPYWVGAR